jgi:hypothetical protein
MRFPWLILTFIFIPFITFAQSGTITGKVTQQGTNKPLARASVFLSNSSIGTITTEEGNYNLSGIRPGQYNLVVTILGYEDYNKPILVGNEPIKLNIEMTQKPLMLREVVISTSADWKKNYEAFKKDFIGVDENAKQCVVMNSHVLNLTFNSTKQTLHADADEFLIVENHALGYRIKFLLREFTADNIEGLVTSGGERLFEDLPGTEAQKQKWHAAREAAYYGSPMHFYRCLIGDKLTEAGFKMYNFHRYLNPDRPNDHVIREKINIFRMQHNVDSNNYYVMKSRLSKYTGESLVQPPLNQFEVLSSGGQPGLYAIHFKTYLYVVYDKKRDEQDYKDLYRPLSMPNYQVSVVTLLDPYAVFDSNGIIVQGSPIYEGTWSTKRLSDMLPYDYVPDVKP